MVARNTETSRGFGVFTAMLRKEDVASMRRNYEMPDGFDESHLVAKEPVLQFDGWIREASKSPNIGEANAMILSTCGRFVVIFLIFSITFNVFFSITRYLLHSIIVMMFAILDYQPFQRGKSFFVKLLFLLQGLSSYSKSGVVKRL